MSARIGFEELAVCLRTPADTLVLFHRNPDADAVGSAFTLRRILEALGSRAFCVCADEIPERLRFLSGDLQESVLPSSIPADLTYTRVVSVDSASPAQLASLWELYGERIDLMIDHHASGDAYAASAYIRPEAAATGEIMFDLVESLVGESKMVWSEEIATLLYAAISADTGGFRFSNVSPKTHERAAALLRIGVDAARINHLLFDAKSMEQLRAEAAAISRLSLYADGRVAVITFPYELKTSLSLSDEHLSTLVDVARSVCGAEIAACIRQPSKEGVFRVSMRSSSEVDVAAICAGFGGGGHVKAAGCTICADSIDAAATRLLDAIDLSIRK